MAEFGQITNVTGTQDVDAFTDALIATLPPIYDKESKDTVLYRLYRALAEELVKVDIALESVGNDNYLSVPVTDELIVRSGNLRDRLQNENAYQLDSIRFRDANSQILQNIFLEEGENKVQLFFVPSSSIDINIFDATQNVARVPLNFPISFDSQTNILTITAPRSGAFTVGYIDTGDVIRTSENITIPQGLFQLGYGEGGYGELGYGE